jgi:hypothetical protein
MDFGALLSIVNEFPLIEIHLLGPVDNLEVPLPQHAQIKYLGVVRHEEIPGYVRNFDALIMPFKVTDLIISVDPVKLYEYVFFNKPIVSVRYSEIERFSQFVDFYSDKNELVAIITRYFIEGFRCKYLDDSRDLFLKANTWAQRVACIELQLGKYGGASGSK